MRRFNSVAVSDFMSDALGRVASILPSKAVLGWAGWWSDVEFCPDPQFGRQPAVMTPRSIKRRVSTYTASPTQALTVRVVGEAEFLARLPICRSRRLLPTFTARMQRGYSGHVAERASFVPAPSIKLGRWGTIRWTASRRNATPPSEIVSVPVHPRNQLGCTDGRYFVCCGQPCSCR
jgi:hypothetical protein